jgi:hypothetical protein
MIKGSKKIIEQGASSTPDVQPVAFKATEEKKEDSTPSRVHRRLQARQRGNGAHHQELLPNPQAKEGERLQVSFQEGLLQVW